MEKEHECLRALLGLQLAIVGLLCWGIVTWRGLSWCNDQLMETRMLEEIRWKDCKVVGDAFRSGQPARHEVKGWLIVARP